jgi:peptidoglycan/xylan/chitin deacetylase (PgdA/CDA1 family)
MAIILLYHRITVTDSDPWALNVSPAHFRQHLEVLRAHRKLATVSDLTAAIAAGADASDVVAITFDDGYSDNLYEALPLLEHYEAPATFYIPSDCVGAEEGFWWDELEQLVLEPDVVPEHLDLVIGGHRFGWEAGSSARLSEQDRREAAGWVAWRPAPSARHSLYAELWAVLQKTSADTRSRAIADLRRWAGSGNGPRESHRTLTHEEVRRLSLSELTAIGAHTRTHPRLASLSEAEQRGEIGGSKTTLENLLGSAVRSFSFPFGKPSDYTPDTIEFIRDAGFDSAVCNVPGAVTSASDRLQLPRCFVEDLNEIAFEDWLRRAHE